ncbi:hypothetical protein [Conchiformibius kuhniae]|uniref:Uncharacterized protein n=1 Tax=Conchiformibius kuhniae TaxID=211502 RepID=A0A8T9MWH6_9NEIS|nr:hypothetical protein [Conchiformibius kuhniae]UOP05511.1 hypothetical protein LVJ77_05130 [Conchiformibius kuhniae]
MKLPFRFETLPLMADNVFSCMALRHHLNFSAENQKNALMPAQMGMTVQWRFGSNDDAPHALH